MSTESEECVKCNLHRWRQRVVRGDGPVPCDIMLIGEAPGRNEDILGKPFVGAAGKILKEALNKAGYEREDVYVTNIIKCRPPGNRIPRKDERLACSEHLQKELDEVHPSKIVLLGRTAKTHFDMLVPVYREDAVEIYNVYHPAYALHKPSMKEVIIGQIVEALR